MSNPDRIAKTKTRKQVAWKKWYQYRELAAKYYAIFNDPSPDTVVQVNEYSFETGKLIRRIKV